ncbi:hypothetical protein [Engelhardtia mirabilis]|uniref:VWFA domain-containing protein n=2 Tax=Engelhardtia mirabilis TaxID=2528011 RepID=A0A518BQQ1_9BACT|nr:hypothetical protein Pla133_44210 [Planctomycetes bacterium Pla133]QDV03628.1 hypothetical protein Pla86_44190 [Planctomycetes bacterium Pla86]
MQMRALLPFLRAAGAGLLLITTALGDKLPQDVVDDIHGPDERKRRSAVSKLADIGTVEAWELIVERLADEEPEVADRAQLELARAAGEDVLEVIHGRDALRSKNPLVRERVVESFGRAERTVEPAELRGAFSDKEAPVRRMAAWSVERLALAGRLGEQELGKLEDALGKAARNEKDGAARGAALVAAATMKLDQARDRIEDALRDRDQAVQCGALIALGTLGQADGPERILTFLDEKRPLALRRAAARGLEAQGDRGALLALADVLENEPRLRLQQMIVAALRGMTGEGIGRNAKAWRAYAEALAEDWSAKREERDIEVGDTVAKLAGLPVLSDRMSVLIDMSGSMWQSGDDGRPLKSLVEVELRRFFELLPEDSRINLVTYATEPASWESKLVQATSRNLAAAMEWFQESRLRGRGNVWDAIDLALEDEEVDTLIVLTDGAPTGGPHWDMKLIPELLLERNRFRQVAFDVILTDPNSGLERRWQDLARRSGGICTSVRFGD